MQETKPKHARGQVTFKVNNFKYKLPQGGTLDIRYKLDDSIDLACDNKSDEVPLIIHNVAKSPVSSNNTY